MRRGLLSLLVFALIPAGAAQAQGRVLAGDYGGWSLPPDQQPATVPLPLPPNVAPPYEAAKPGDEQLWFRTDYLLWFVTHGGPHFPLVTTDTNPGTATAGSLASPTTVPLYGNNGFDYHMMSGTRLTLGGFFDKAQTIGLEASGFLLAQRTVGFSANSDNTGRPALYVPAYNAVTQREDSVVVADPVLGFQGGVAVASSLQLWGTELNMLHRLYKSQTWQVDVLGGFRYVDLAESLDLTNTTTDNATGMTTMLADRFYTRNQFYGAQAGIRAQGNWGNNLFASGSFQLALGATHQVVDTSGASVTATGATAPGGIFAEPSNIGRQAQGTFSVIPQFAGVIGCRLTTSLSLLVGYDVLLWTDTVRAGNQIDRTLNLSQNAVLGTGTLAGVARPAPQFNRSDFTAQGVSLGLLWQY